ncbi:hypothetical protein KQI85_07030 [Falcatimonas sp. MSJ-15]|uniref:hypothetical protein n=1 Tax=Falcatimonas sp. MSJ-15 TaxID=2841515 RepID=UPI001C1139BA|nr:hypothetical protein [Falcatimonas sp. MSJ-15]MBU5470120.1 hypothetical protein [Falcatimonas sp. MSJ-15]
MTRAEEEELLKLLIEYRNDNKRIANTIDDEVLSSIILSHNLTVESVILMISTGLNID